MSNSFSINRLALVLGLFIAPTQNANGQNSTTESSKWELRISSGAFVPTGDQRDILEDAQITSLQVSRVINHSLAITGTFGWARSRDLTSIDTPKLDVYTSDLGLEIRPRRWFPGNAVTFDAFAGVGAGARSYNYRKLDEEATHNLAGYAAVGGEVGMGRFGLRVEVRDYVTGFKPLIGPGNSQTRNDIVIAAAVRFNRNRGSQN